MHNSYIQFTFNLQVHLVVIFQTLIDAKNYSAFNNLSDYLDVKKNEEKKL